MCITWLEFGENIERLAITNFNKAVETVFSGYLTQDNFKQK